MTKQLICHVEYVSSHVQKQRAQLNPQVKLDKRKPQLRALYVAITNVKQVSKQICDEYIR